MLGFNCVSLMVFDCFLFYYMYIASVKGNSHNISPEPKVSYVSMCMLLHSSRLYNFVTAGFELTKFVKTNSISYVVPE